VSEGERDERDTEDTFAGAPVTLAIILVNLAIFAGEVIASRSLWSLWEVPRAVGLLFGSSNAPLAIGLGQYERLVASCFLHGSLMHVGLNMWSLRQIGPFAEQTVGSARYSVLYVVTGIAGSVTSLVWRLLVGGGDVPSLGASGAICGVMGAALVLGVRLDGWRSPIAKQIGFWLLLIVAYGAWRQGVDNAAHVGGMIAGLIIASLWRRGIHYSKAATLASIGGATAICVASGLVVLWRDATDPYVLMGPNDRSHEVSAALVRRDCPAARRALLATQKVVAPGTPELAGLREQVERACGK
jgi:rhomboid protease GluP